MRGIRMLGPMRKRQRKKNAIRYLDEFNRGLDYYWRRVVKEESDMYAKLLSRPALGYCAKDYPDPMRCYAEITYATPELPDYFPKRDTSAGFHHWVPLK